MARLTKTQIAANEAAQAAAAQQAIQAAQLAELKRLRAEKAVATRRANKAAKVQPAVAEHIAAVQPDPVHADARDFAFADFFGDLQLPSAGRVVVGCILGLAASGVTGYGIGMLMAYALAGIMTLTSTAWIAFMLSVLVWVIGLYAAWKVGGYVAGRVFASVVLPEGLASRSYESVANATSDAKQRVTGWFSTRRNVVDQFTGAFSKAA